MKSRACRAASLGLALLAALGAAPARAQTPTVAQLKNQILATWRIQIADANLAATIVPVVPKADQPVTMTDVSPANETACLNAVIAALSVYPAGFVSGLVSRIALADDITAYAIRIGGFQIPGLLALNCGQAAAAAQFDEDSVHNELAGLLLAKDQPDLAAWRRLNPQNFTYGDMASVKAALADPQGRTGDDALYAHGFVSRLGLTDITNDFDTFAGQVFGHPAATAALVKAYPALKPKVARLMSIYLAEAPGLRTLFDQSGLTAATGR